MSNLGALAPNHPVDKGRKRPLLHVYGGPFVKNNSATAAAVGFVSGALAAGFVLWTAPQPVPPEDISILDVDMSKDIVVTRFAAGDKVAEFRGTPYYTTRLTDSGVDKARLGPSDPDHTMMVKLGGGQVTVMCRTAD